MIKVNVPQSGRFTGVARVADFRDVQQLQVDLGSQLPAGLARRTANSAAAYEFRRITGGPPGGSPSILCYMLTPFDFVAAEDALASQPIAYKFIDAGTQLSEAPRGRVVVDVGRMVGFTSTTSRHIESEMAHVTTAPGGAALDHHQLTCENPHAAESAASLVYKQREQIAESCRGAKGHYSIVMHRRPDFDAITAAAVAQLTLEHRASRLPREAEQFIEYVRLVDNAAYVSPPDLENSLGLVIAKYIEGTSNNLISHHPPQH